MDEYNIIKFCIDYAKNHAALPSTQEQIDNALEWLERMAALSYEIDAKEDARTEDG